MVVERKMNRRVRTIAFLIFSGCFVCCKTQHLIPDPEKETIHGRPYAYAEHEYTASKGSVQTFFSVQHAVVQYDRHRKKISEVRFDADTNVTAMWFFQYDEKGRLKEEKWLNADSSVAYRIEYGYKKSRLTKEEHYASGNVFEKCFLYEYSSRGRLMAKHVYNREGTLIQLIRYQYHPAEIHELFFSSDSILQSEVRYETDKRKRLLKITEYDGKGQFLSCVVYRYDRKWNVVEKTEEEEGEITKKLYYYHYEFDRKGNWLMKVELKNNIPSTIILREYEYF